MKREEIAEAYTSFKSWYGFDETTSDAEKAECVKGAIGKTLKEFVGDDERTNLYAKGYDHVIIPHAVVGMNNTSKVILDKEIVVLPEAVDRVSIVSSETGVYHYSNASFDKFDADCIGFGHGISYGAGFYLTDTPIPEYGKKYNVDISSLKKAYTLNLFDDESVVDYLYACIA